MRQFRSVIVGFVVGAFAKVVTNLPLVVVVAIGVVGYAATFPIERWWQRHKPSERGVPGWGAVVTEYEPSPRFPNMWALHFRLFGPKGSPADGAVSCEVAVDGTTFQSYSDRDLFNDHILAQGQGPHYLATFPGSFVHAVRSDGQYVVRWYEVHGLSRRLLARPARFTILNGRVKGAKRT